MVVLSCSTGSFPDLPLESSLARIAWAGFRSTELFLPASAPLPEVGSLAAALEEADLSLAAIDAGALEGESVEAGLKAAAHAGRCAVLAQSLQANRVVCDLAIGSEPLAREIIGRLLAALAPVPVLLCFRNRPEDGAEACQQLLGLIATEPDRLGLALDPGAASRAGWELRRDWEWVAPAVRHLYVSDAAGRASAVPGEGDVDWEGLAERLRDGGYSGAASLWLAGPEAFHDPLFAEAELKEARFLMESWFNRAE